MKIFYSRYDFFQKSLELTKIIIQKLIAPNGLKVMLIFPFNTFPFGNGQPVVLKSMVLVLRATALITEPNTGTVVTVAHTGKKSCVPVVPRPRMPHLLPADPQQF